MGNINYRAVHTKSPWRKVGRHKTLEAAIDGKDGAAGLFAHKARIDYEKHGDPRYVIVWEQGAQSGFVIKSAPNALNGIRKASIPVSDILTFDRNGGARATELERYF